MGLIACTSGTRHRIAQSASDAKLSRQASRVLPGKLDVGEGARWVDINDDGVPTEKIAAAEIERGYAVGRDFARFHPQLRFELARRQRVRVVAAPGVVLGVDQ